AADQPDEDRVGGVQEHVDEVVAEGVETPEMVIQPEAREGERVVLRDGARFEPDAPEPVEAPQRRVGGDVGIVVPDEPGAEGGKVRRDDEESEGQRGRRATAGDGWAACGYRRRLPAPPVRRGSRPMIRRRA